MLLENQVDLKKNILQKNIPCFHQNYEHLKQMEMELTKKMGNGVHHHIVFLHIIENVLNTSDWLNIQPN